MPVIDNPLTAVLERSLQYHDRRQDILASNVANANTPGYKAFDLVLQSRVEQMPTLAPRTSDPRHLSESTETEGLDARLSRSRAPARLDGNNVSLEDEFVRLTENRMLYQAAFELYDRWKDLNRVAREIR